MKRIIAKAITVIISLAILAAALTFSVSASPNDASITINIGTSNLESNLNGKTFSAYKIFDVTDSASGYFYTLDSRFSSFDNYPNAATTELKDYINSLANNSSEMNILAGNLWSYINTNSIAVTGSQVAVENDSVTISGLPQGYYLVSGSAVYGGATVIAAPALVTAADSTAYITLKASAPTLKSQIAQEPNLGSPN